MSPLGFFRLSKQFSNQGLLGISSSEIRIHSKSLEYLKENDSLQLKPACDTIHNRYTIHHPSQGGYYMLAELKGSPKQVSWARRIRTDRLSHWKKTAPISFEEKETILNNQSSASWWITHREKELEEVLPHIIEGGEKNKAAASKPKALSPPAPTVTSKANYEINPEESYRVVGELRSMSTGEVVTDYLECPF